MKNMKKDDAISKTSIIFLANALLYELIIIITLLVLVIEYNDIDFIKEPDFIKSFFLICGIALILLTYFAHWAYRTFKKSLKGERINQDIQQDLHF